MEYLIAALFAATVVTGANSPEACSTETVKAENGNYLYLVNACPRDPSAGTDFDAPENATDQM